MGIAETAAAALQQERALSSLLEVADKRLAIFLINGRTKRDSQHRIRTVRASHFAAHAMLAAPGAHMLPIAIVGERVQVFHRLGPDIAAATTIPAVWSA